MSKVEPRYARALLDAAQDAGCADTVLPALGGISRAIEESAELKWFLRNPVVPGAAKKETLGELFSEEAPACARNFLSLLVDKGRLGSLGGIIEEYSREKALRDGVLNVTVSSPYPLEQTQLDEIAVMCQKKYNAKRVQIESVTDASLLGGVRIRAGSEEIDGTVSGRLRQLAKLCEFDR